MTGKAIFDAIRAAGLAPVKDLALRGDGKLLRYRVAGDKAGSRNGWVVLNDGVVSFGAFGSWKTGESHTWRSGSENVMTPSQREDFRRQMIAATIARDQERQKVREEARVRAQKLWERGKPATNAHPYLQRKRVGAHGIRQLRDMLMIPARDASGALWTLQFIQADGTKRFLTGGRIEGCYFAMGKPEGRVIVCEGLATGSTLREAVGAAVACAFSCGNLLPVCLALRKKFPQLAIVVCADNDHATLGNPGVTSAKAAAKAVRGVVCIPSFEGVSHG